MFLDRILKLDFQQTRKLAYIRRCAVWPDLAKFRHFGKKLKLFGKHFTVYLVFGKN